MISTILRRIADPVEAACLFLGGICLFYMVFVVAFNVLARVIFDVTDTGVNMMIPGAIEQVSYLLGIVALAALAASLKEGMIAVDFVVERLPDLPRALVARFWFLSVVVLALVLAWLFWEDAHATYRRSEQTQDLRIPMFLVFGLYALQCLALAIIALREAFTSQGCHGELA
tara:strand:+ start:1518 stop:2033 length:516 start_codon:yes stop_codon:yes gene_type:complete